MTTKRLDTFVSNSLNIHQQPAGNATLQLRRRHAQRHPVPGATLSGTQCSGTTSTRTAHVYLEDKQIAETVVDGARQYVHTDALGLPMAHTNQAGAEPNRTKFEPYGLTAAGTKPGAAVAGLTTTGSAIGFTGHVNDPETDLVYMQQRYYDPVAGRFLSVDPVVTDTNTGGSFNRYNFANNNPYLFTDPDGRCGVREGLGCYTTVFPEGPSDSYGGGGDEAKPIAGKPNSPYFTGNSYIDKTTLELNAMALIAEETVGKGSGAVHGTLVHTAFATLVRAAKRPDLHAEQSFDLNGLVHYGFAGAIRTDVSQGPDKAFLLSSMIFKQDRRD